MSGFGPKSSREKEAVPQSSRHGRRHFRRQPLRQPTNTIANLSGNEVADSSNLADGETANSLGTASTGRKGTRFIKFVHL